jgi:hypothetical protein
MTLSERKKVSRGQIQITANILTVSFLLAVTLSMLVQNIMPTMMMMTTAIFQEQIAYAQEEEEGDERQTTTVEGEGKGRGGEVEDEVRQEDAREVEDENTTSLPKEEEEKGKESRIADEEEVTQGQELLTTCNLDEVLEDDKCILKPEVNSTKPEPEQSVKPCKPDEISIGGRCIPKPTDRELPDDDCLFNPDLKKCAPIDGECPDGFAMNEDGQCYPDKPCPKGYERRDDDETGRCYSVKEKHLKIIVTVKGADGGGKISIDSKEAGDGRFVDNIQGPHTFKFYKNTIPVGTEFKACAYSDKLGKEVCSKGKNGPENEPEQVTIRFTPQHSNNQVLQLTTNKKTYKLGETVTFTIKNKGDQTLYFSNGLFGLQIKNLDTGKNCDRITTQVITELKPGESIKQSWDQKCDDEENVKPGKYGAKVASGSVSADSTFSITESPLPPSAGTGLKVIVTVKGADVPGEISVKSLATGKILIKMVDNIIGTHTFQFKPGEVPVGGEFEACAKSFEKASDKLSKVFPRKESCVKGKNGPELEPEKVTIRFFTNEK